MKKLYRKGQVHPSPSPAPAAAPAPPSSEQFSLAYLPAAILTLAAALSSQDKEVLAYLLSCSSTTPFDFDPFKSSSKKHVQQLEHLPSFSCYCFTCYTSYWARWDSSPNRQLIHEIIDAFEDNLMAQRKKKQGLSRREKRKNNNQNNNNNNNKGCLDSHIVNNISLNQSCCGKINNATVDANHRNGSDGSVRVNTELGRVDSVGEDNDEQQHLCDETGEKQGSVRKIVSFIGERIWGSVWG